MKSLLCIIILVCIAVCHAQEAEETGSADVFWQDTSAGYKFLWTKQDFTYEKNGKIESLFKWMTKEIYCQMDENDPDTKCLECLLPGHCVDEYTYRLLSVYGSLVSFEIEYVSWPGRAAYPARSVTVITFDLSKDKYKYKQYLEELSHEYQSSKADYIDDLRNKPNILIRLDELFDGKVILRELLKNEVIHQALVEYNVDIKKLTTASDLAKPGLAGHDVPFFFYNHEITSDYLTRFSFYDITEDDVIIELGFAHLRRGSPMRIKISLPKSSIIKEFLPSADGSFGALLQKDAEIQFGKKTTKFIYEN